LAAQPVCVYDRSVDKRRITVAGAKYLLNPVVRLLFRLRLPVPGIALLETTGRKSGQPRVNPVGNGLDGDVFWIVAENGLQASYVRNIQANPRVRVRPGWRWREGTAHLVPDEDPRERQRKMRGKLNSAVVRAMATEMLVVRVDLDPR
jgi:deazaflavin-dependent oxidoreductase (nitroreductase family)